MSFTVNSTGMKYRAARVLLYFSVDTRVWGVNHRCPLPSMHTNGAMFPKMKLNEIEIKNKTKKNISSRSDGTGIRMDCVPGGGSRSKARHVKHVNIKYFSQKTIRRWESIQGVTCHRHKRKMKTPARLPLNVWRDVAHTLRTTECVVRFAYFFNFRDTRKAPDRMKWTTNRYKSIKVSIKFAL